MSIAFLFEGFTISVVIEFAESHPSISTKNYSSKNASPLLCGMDPYDISE
jgi:hypothetical protein